MNHEKSVSFDIASYQTVGSLSTKNYLAHSLTSEPKKAEVESCGIVVKNSFCLRCDTDNPCNIQAKLEYYYSRDNL
jgi:hypothetical protein